MRKTYIIRNDIDAQKLANAIRVAKIEKPLVVMVEPYRKRRSVAQNRLNFLWCDVIRKWMWDSGIGFKDASGESMRPFTVEEIHEYNKELFLPPRVVEVNGKAIAMHRSRDLPVAVFSEFLEQVDAHWTQQGCNLPRPDDIYSEAMHND